MCTRTMQLVQLLLASEDSGKTPVAHTAAARHQDRGNNLAHAHVEYAAANLNGRRVVIHNNNPFDVGIAPTLAFVTPTPALPLEAALLIASLGACLLEEAVHVVDFTNGGHVRLPAGESWTFEFPDIRRFDAAAKLESATFSICQIGEVPEGEGEVEVKIGDDVIPFETEGGEDEHED